MAFRSTLPGRTACPTAKQGPANPPTALLPANLLTPAFPHLERIGAAEGNLPHSGSAEVRVHDVKRGPGVVLGHIRSIIEKTKDRRLKRGRVLRLTVPLRPEVPPRASASDAVSPPAPEPMAMLSTSTAPPYSQPGSPSGKAYRMLLRICSFDVAGVWLARRGYPRRDTAESSPLPRAWPAVDGAREQDRTGTARAPAIDGAPAHPRRSLPARTPPRDAKRTRSRYSAPGPRLTIEHPETRTYFASR